MKSMVAIPSFFASRVQPLVRSIFPSNPSNPVNPLIFSGVTSNLSLMAILPFSSVTVRVSFTSFIASCSLPLTTVRVPRKACRVITIFWVNCRVMLEHTLLEDSVTSSYASFNLAKYNASKDSYPIFTALASCSRNGLISSFASFQVSVFFQYFLR